MYSHSSKNNKCNLCSKATQLLETDCEKFTTAEKALLGVYKISNFSHLYKQTNRNIFSLDNMNNQIIKMPQSHCKNQSLFSPTPYPYSYAKADISSWPLALLCYSGYNCTYFTDIFEQMELSKRMKYTCSVSMTSLSTSTDCIYTANFAASRSLNWRSDRKLFYI